MSPLSVFSSVPTATRCARVLVCAGTQEPRKTPQENGNCSGCVSQRAKGDFCAGYGDMEMKESRGSNPPVEPSPHVCGPTVVSELPDAEGVPSVLPASRFSPRFPTPKASLSRFPRWFPRPPLGSDA